MTPVSLPVGAFWFAILISLVSPQPTSLLRQQRNEDAFLDVVQSIPYDSPEYHRIIPNNDYPVAAVEPTELSILDVILSPFTAILGLGSSALSVIFSIAIKGGLVLLGMAIVIGFCALTPYCTLTIEKPSFFARETISSFPYLEDLENFFNDAYSKYQEMQSSS